MVGSYVGYKSFKCLDIAQCAKNQFSVHDGAIYILVDDQEIEIELSDYIVKGQSGNFYPCKPSIFWKTYEEVKDNEYHEI